jgi:hypothetical protein
MRASGHQASNNWGIELNGAEEDKAVWRALLKPPFDPFVEEVEDECGNYLALRASAFDGLAANTEVHERAKVLFRTLNVAMSTHADADPVKNGAVVDFSQNGRPRRHHFLEVNPIALRTRIGLVTVSTTDTKGNVIAPPPAPSRAQLWMRAALLDPEIGSALRYLEGRPNWVDLYKAYEAVRRMPNGGISKAEINRFTQTANVGNRHHPNKTSKPHARPLELWEARSLIMSWISAAIEHVLARKP